MCPVLKLTVNHVFGIISETRSWNGDARISRNRFVMCICNGSRHIQSYKDVREIVLVHCVAVKIIGITGVWTLTEMFSLASR